MVQYHWGRRRDNPNPHPGRHSRGQILLLPGPQPHACLILIRIIQNSAFGQTIVAIRENRAHWRPEGLAPSIDQLRYRRFFAGIAGSLLAILNRAVSELRLLDHLGQRGPHAAFWGGGRGLYRPPGWAAIITLLEHYISLYTYYWQFVLGLLIILFVLRDFRFLKDRFSGRTAPNL